MSRDPICQYCYEAPVAFQWEFTCQSCTYLCEGCGLVTPYESGGSDDMPQHCDTCWHVAHEKDLVI